MKIPKSLEWISLAIGADATNRLLLQYSGRRVFFPSAKNLKRDHQLVSILGWDIAYKFCQTVQAQDGSGDRVVFPSTYTLSEQLKEERDAVIRKMREYKFTKNEIGLVFDLCRRQVANITNKPDKPKLAAKSNFILKPRSKKAYCEGQLSLLEV